MSIRNMLGGFFIRLGTRLLQIDSIDKTSFIEGDFIVLPKLPYPHGRIVEIAVNGGEAVLSDELLIAVEFDDMVLDIPCPCHCVIKDVLIQLEEEVSIGQRLFKIRSLE